MKNDREGSAELPSAQTAAQDFASDPQQAVELENKATRLHQISRLRSRHFLTPLMADSAMDIMLSLFVGALQRSKVSDGFLATANLLSRDEADALVDKLVQAGLAVITGENRDGRTVGLTPLGSARMRSFVNDHPDV